MNDRADALAEQGRVCEEPPRWLAELGHKPWKPVEQRHPDTKAGIETVEKLNCSPVDSVTGC